jgi:hypothetical protein
MPTPTRSFHDIAARYGNVDAEDPKAVQRWFMDVLPTLPSDTIEEILEALLEGDGTTDEKQTVRSYPQGVPLPSLSGSPAAPTPLLAAGLKELLNRLTKQRTKG